MRFVYIIAALLVAASIYMLVIQRDVLLQFAGRETPAEATVAAGAADGTTDGAGLAEAEPGATVVEEAPERIRVVALASEAKDIDTAVLVRGRTEAARQVEVRSETSGLIVNEPLRKGALVEAGDVLCQVDPGTREVALDDARARLKEAEARLPEGRARVEEAEARLNEAEINDRAARSLSASGFAAETRVAATAAAVSSAKAQVETARAFYQHKARLMESALRQHFAGLGRWTQPRGGLFIWVELENGRIDTLPLLEESVDKDRVAFIPGRPFFVDGSGGNCLRLSYSNVTDDNISLGLEKLSRRLRAAS